MPSGRCRFQRQRARHRRRVRLPQPCRRAMRIPDPQRRCRRQIRSRVRWHRALRRPRRNRQRHSQRPQEPHHPHHPQHPHRRRPVRCRTALRRRKLPHRRCQAPEPRSPRCRFEPQPVRRFQVRTDRRQPLAPYPEPAYPLPNRVSWPLKSHRLRRAHRQPRLRLPHRHRQLPSRNRRVRRRLERACALPKINPICRQIRDRRSMRREGRARMPRQRQNLQVRLPDRPFRPLASSSPALATCLPRWEI